MIRLFDIIFSTIGIIVLLPILIPLYILIILESKGGGFYIQERIGKNGKPFSLYKFRTMQTGSDNNGQLTIGQRDSRITRIGYYLRKTKADEIPQLFNVLKGEMSLVGPRPEVKKYVDMYSNEQRQVLCIRPGITDYASIKYANENELLAKVNDPERVYIEQIMPDKIKLNMMYIQHHTVSEYFKIIFLTFKKVLA